MTLRTKLILMFFGALQVTFLTAVAAFWAVQSWQLLTDDLTLIYDQSRRLERTLEHTRATRDAPEVLEVHPGAEAPLRAMREHAQTLEEMELIDGLGGILAGDAAGGAVPAIGTGQTIPAGKLRNAAQSLKRYYRANVRQLRARSRFVTRVSTALFIGIVVAVLTAMMAYFMAIRAWLVRPIQVLSHATGIISTGNLDHRIPVTGRDELGNLAASINTMAASLTEIQDRLVMAERFALVGEMSAYVAHNIRNPVASIRATAQDELDRTPPDDLRYESLVNVVKAADRITSWVGDLLRFSSPVSLHKSVASLNSLVTQCVDLSQSQLTGKDVHVKLALDPALPTVSLDRNKMEQVVSAVLNNALEASPSGGTIDVASALEEGPNSGARAAIRVEDRGAGIPKERLKTVFTPFSTTKKSGTGLGLSLAHKIVTAHNGSITVASRDGGGTVVEIQLPAQPTGNEG
jgi:signal transduction histidine kinase